MFDKILPSIYRRLRERTELSQEMVAAELDVTRQTVTNYELGKTRPEPLRERRLVALAQCSQEELAELTCEEMSLVLGRRVAILADDKGYLPTTPLGQAEQLLRRRPAVPRSLLRALENQMHAQGLAPPLRQLETSLAALHQGTQGSNASLEAKERSMLDLEKLAGQSGRLLEALYAYAGHEGIANRTRPSSHVSRRAARSGTAPASTGDRSSQDVDPGAADPGAADQGAADPGAADPGAADPGAADGPAAADAASAATPAAPSFPFERIPPAPPTGAAEGTAAAGATRPRSAPAETS